MDLGPAQLSGERDAEGNWDEDERESRPRAKRPGAGLSLARRKRFGEARGDIFASFALNALGSMRPFFTLRTGVALGAGGALRSGGTGWSTGARRDRFVPRSTRTLFCFWRACRAS